MNFVRDVAPYFAPTAVYLVNHLVYQFCSGNLFWVLFVAYLFNFPYFKYHAKPPRVETNLDRDSEKIFRHDKRFMYPVYSFVFVDCLTWIWCLCVVSGVHPSFLPTSIFEDKLTQTFGGYMLFVYVWGYMAGVNGLAGHELIHRKESYDKAIGMFTFSKIYYSHFLMEHGSGHHRNVATPEDSATARLGETFFTFCVRSALGGHVNTWRREVSRLQMKYDCEYLSPVTLATENKMVWFFALHLSMFVAIQTIFGWRACAFQFLYALVGIFFIELINYTEHYGLLRKKDIRGIYEPINE